MPHRRYGSGKYESPAFEENEIEAYVKYNTFDKEQTKAWKKQIGRLENMTYDEELDEWICAANQRLVFRYETKQKSDNGYESVKRVYMCTDCHRCPFQEACAKGKDTKSVKVSIENQKQRKEVRERLATEEGKEKYKQRKIDVEPVFGQIKHNRQFHRFSLRGLSKKYGGLGSILCCPQFKKVGSTAEEKEKSNRVKEENQTAPPFYNPYISKKER